MSESVFGWLVPHRGDHSEARIDRCLKAAEKDTQDGQSSEVMAGSRAHKNATPDYARRNQSSKASCIIRGHSHSQDDNLCSRKFDQRDGRNRAGNQEANVEKARHPRILRAAQFLLELARALHLSKL